MSAPSIPNLNSIRKPRGALRAGPGRRDKTDNDTAIRNTDLDASSSRISAVQAGYLDDPFAKYLCPENWQPRLPLMNRGTYIRTTALDRIVDTFLDSTRDEKQIVSLGAGSDTRYFRLKRQKRSNFIYHELDFRENTSIKIERLKRPQAKTAISGLCDVDLDKAESKNGELSVDNYQIHATDLRTLTELPWLDRNQPTLIISECCLIYLPPDQADQVLELFSNHLDGPLAFAIYEPFRPNDSFGRTMIRNLTTRGIVLETIEKYAELENQRERLGKHGFEAKAADTEFIFRSWIHQEEKDRISSLEMLDEVSWWCLLTLLTC